MMVAKLNRSVAAILVSLGVLAQAGCVPSATRSDLRSEAGPPHVRRGDRVEALYRVYRGRLERLHDSLSERGKDIGLDLLPKLQAAIPKPVVQGYQILPRLLPDAPPRDRPPRANSAGYSWPWTERLIDRETTKIQALEAQAERIQNLPLPQRQAAHEQVLADFVDLDAWRKIIDGHIQYNRLWQAAIAANRSGYDRQTVLHDAVLERQAILDALSATDDTAFGQALKKVAGIDATKSAAELKDDLRAREKELAGRILDATGANPPPSFARIEHSGSHLWVVHLPVYTDIADLEFVQAVKNGIEGIWHVRDGEDEFRVELSIKYISPTVLYAGIMAPQAGEQIDLNKHLVVFPTDGAVLTTGAMTTSIFGRAIVLGPHDIATRVLAHEFGHLLGFKDVYFRGYRDLGENGFEVWEVVAASDDIMGAPGSGPVLRRHFEWIIEALGRR
jgi:hypothetical protein